MFAKQQPSETRGEVWNTIRYKGFSTWCRLFGGGIGWRRDDAEEVGLVAGCWVCFSLLVSCLLLKGGYAPVWGSILGRVGKR